MTLGTGVILLPMCHPITIAYDAAVLDQICGGRLVIGVGIGRPHDWARFGLERAEIGDRMDEMLAALKALSAAPTASTGRRSTSTAASPYSRRALAARRSGSAGRSGERCAGPLCSAMAGHPAARPPWPASSTWPGVIARRWRGTEGPASGRVLAAPGIDGHRRDAGAPWLTAPPPWRRSSRPTPPWAA